MKKIFTSLIMLSALLCSTTAFAASYAITIGGTGVTDANKADIKPSGLTKGKITFNSSSNVLTFTDVTLNSGSNLNVDVGEGFSMLKINFVGTNNFTSDSHNFWFDSPVIMDGGMNSDATVNITNTVSGKCGIVFNSAADYSAIYNMYLNVKTVATAIAANWTNKGQVDLWFSCLHMNVESSNSNAFNYFKSIHFDSGDAYLTEGQFDSNKQTVVNASGNAMSSVKVRAGLYVNNCIPRIGSGATVYTLNPEGLTSGTITYQASTKTLTFDNAQMNLGSAYFFTNNKVDGLKVVVKGTNSLKNSVSGIQLYANTTFEGADPSNYSGNVLMMSSSGKSYPGIVCHGCDLTLKDINLWVTAQRALEGDNGHTITFDHAGGILSATEGASNPRAINGFSNCVLANQTDFVSAYYSTTKRALIDNDGNEAKGVIYAPYTNEYPIWILGHQLNDVNSPFGFACEGAKGKIVYSNSDKLLTLEDVTLAAPSGANAYGIRSQVDGLKIQLDGTATDITSDRAAIYFEKNAEITGTAKLTAESTNGTALSIYGNHKVTINVNNEVHFNGKDYGYWGHHQDSNPDCDLILTKAGGSSDYYFKGAQACIYQASHIICNDMDFYYSSSYGTPGCYFDENTHYVKQNGGTIVKGSDVNFYQVNEKYGITVAGVEITSCNQNAIGSPAINKPLGVVYSSNTLYLDGVTIDYTATDSNTGVIQTPAGTTLDINVTGDCTVKSNNAYAALWLCNTTATIEGDGTLNTSGKFADIYPMSGGTLTITGDVTVNAPNKGITSNNAPDGLVIGGNSIVRAKEISGMKAITLLDDHSVVAPAGAEINGGNIVVGGSIAQNVVIMQVVEYALKVNDAKVTSANCADILGDGTMSYDDATSTLTMNNVNVPNYDGWSASFIANTGINGLKIVVTGDNNIQCRDGANVIYTNYETALIGTGTLTSNKGLYIVSPGADPSAAKLIIDGPTVTIDEVSGWENNDLLAVLSGKLTCTTSGAPIYGIEVLDLGEGMYITTPNGGSFSSALKGITTDGSSLYYGDLVIGGATAYDLAVAGKTVTTANCNDILGSGDIKYDDASKTLTISGNYDYTGDFIDSSIDGLTINVAGDSKITVLDDYNSALFLKASTTITGGKLTLVSAAPAKNALGIYITSGTLTIKDADIDVTGDGFTYAITGEGTGTQLVIENSDVTATAHIYGAIYDWEALTLNNCYVEEPRPSQIFNYGIAAANGVIVGSGENYGTVVIKKGVDAINGIDEAQTTVTDIYDATGRKLDQTRRGVNIVRTNDGKTHKILKK